MPLYSENAIGLPALPWLGTPARSICHGDPPGRPFSVKVTGYWTVRGITVKTTETETGPLETVRFPSSGVTEYELFEDSTPQKYAPFGTASSKEAPSAPWPKNVELGVTGWGALGNPP